MPKAEYEKKKADLAKEGIEVFAATEGDDLRYMLAIGAEGTYSNGRITHIGQIPSRGTLEEEIIHMHQSQKYGELGSSDSVELVAREIAANRKLLNEKDRIGLDELDTADVERNLKIWEKAFADLTGGSYDEKNHRRDV